MPKTKAAPPPPPPAPDPPPPPEKPGLPTRIRRLLFRPRVLLLFAAIVSSTFVVPLLIQSLPSLRERDEFRVQSDAISMTPPPRWVPADFVERVLETSSVGAELSLLDNSLLKNLYEAFRRDPWVAQVVRVRKVPPNRVDVELVYRRPVAMVEVAEGLYPIDPNGTLLPPGDFSAADANEFPLIRNVTSKPQGPAGTNWGDVAILGAARLAEALLQAPPRKPSHWERLGLVAIRVPDATGSTGIEDLCFELLAPGGSRIIWGRAPGSTHPGELTVEQKIGRLEKYVADFGGFDRPHGPYEIDIRHWQEISRRPLAAATESSRHR